MASAQIRQIYLLSHISRDDQPEKSRCSGVSLRLSLATRLAQKIRLKQQLWWLISLVKEISEAKSGNKHSLLESGFVFQHRKQTSGCKQQALFGKIHQESYQTVSNFVLWYRNHDQMTEERGQGLEQVWSLVRNRIIGREWQTSLQLICTTATTPTLHLLNKNIQRFQNRLFWFTTRNSAVGGGRVIWWWEATTSRTRASSERHPTFFPPKHKRHHPFSVRLQLFHPTFSSTPAGSNRFTIQDTSGLKHLFWMARLHPSVVSVTFQVLTEHWSAVMISMVTIGQPQIYKTFRFQPGLTLFYPRPQYLWSCKTNAYRQTDRQIVLR